MFRLRRIIGWLFLVVVAIFLVSLLGANLYVQSQATQERIQQELSQRLKMPLQIQRISVTPWGGLKLSGITIQIGMTRWVMFFECSASGESSDGCSWSWLRFFWYRCWGQTSMCNHRQHKSGFSRNSANVLRCRCKFSASASHRGAD